MTPVLPGPQARETPLGGRWRLRAKAPLDRFRLLCAHDPLLDGVTLRADGDNGGWLRLLYDVTAEVAGGGPFRIDLHVAAADGAPPEWVALLRREANGDQRFQGRAVSGGEATGAVSLMATVPPAQPGVGYEVAVSLARLPATVQASAITCFRSDQRSDGGAPAAGRPDLPMLARAVQPLLWEQWYAPAHRLPPDTPLGQQVARFLADPDPDARPNPMFDPGCYRRRIGLPAGEHAFLHWLSGDRRLHPAPLFDEAEYRAVEPVPADADAFLYYLTSGYRRNHAPSQFFDARWYARRYGPLDIPAMVHWALHGAAAGLSPAADIPAPPPGLTLEAIASDLRARTATLARAPIRALVEKAALIEPQLMRPLGPRRLTVAPSKHSRARPGRAGTLVRRALAGRRFHTLLAIPQCRMAGAARLAGSLARALVAIRPDEPLLVVLTERSDWERPDWFPDAAEILNLPALLGPDFPEDPALLLLDLIRGLGIRRLFNVNSGSAWQLLARHGRQLAPETALYAYLFNWDLDEAGTRIGYPVSALPPAFDHLDAVTVDNRPLAAELQARYALSDAAAARRLPVLSTPAEPSPTDCHAAFGARGGERLRCLWAGRFDRQKRMDLVLALARLRPDLDIDLYGKPVLGDTGSDPAGWPANVRACGVFGSLDELDLPAYDLFLYTSAWDGLPNMVLEVAMRGMALVASAVGGVPDLVTAETGWPVERWDEPAAYAHAIDTMRADPAAVHARAARLRGHARARFTDETYARELDALLAREAPRP